MSESPPGEPPDQEPLEREPLLSDTAGPSSDSRSFWLGLLTAGLTSAAAGVVVFIFRGGDGVMLFTASYLMELSLSMDNMFAFFLIFRFYRCPNDAQAACLFWGILGAIVLRALVLVLGAAMVQVAKPLMLIFAAVLMYSAYGMVQSLGKEDDDDDDDLSQNRVVRCVRSLHVPVTEGYRGARLVVRENGRWVATPLLLVLATVELSDVVFAMDSVPAVLGLTSDALIAYPAVMCAVLGLRAIYTLTVILINSFRFLQHAVALLLAFIGAKIALDVLFGIVMPTRIVLLVILGTLGGAMLGSVCANHLSRWKLHVVAPTWKTSADSV